MKTNSKQIAWAISVVLAGVGLAGCSKNSDKLVTEQLNQSFEKADATVKQEVVQVNTAFQAGDYTRAISLMDQVVKNQPIDVAQKQAVNTLIIQTRQAVQQNPKLNTPELYKATEALMLSAHGEN